MLLNYYDERNRVVERGLAVVKERQLVFGKWVGEALVGGSTTTYDRMWRSTRTATMSYRYVGMDLATAKACAAAMEAYWTRSTTVSVWSSTAGEMGDWNSVSGGSVLMAEVAVVKSGEGPMFEVEVRVSERDEKWRKTSADVSWATEDAREYDGGEG